MTLELLAHDIDPNASIVNVITKEFQYYTKYSLNSTRIQSIMLKDFFILYSLKSFFKKQQAIKIF